MGFLSSVNAHVEFYLSFFSETLSTLIRLLSSVNLYVLFKVSFMSKNLSTVFAGERFLFSVNSHVSFKGFILKGSYDAFFYVFLFFSVLCRCLCMYKICRVTKLKVSHKRIYSI